jgi:hypothetical protein
MVLAGETEVVGENLPQRHFVHHKSLLPDPGANPGRRGGEPATNRFSYGAAISQNLLGRTDEIHGNLNKDSQSVCQVFESSTAKSTAQ